jgi:tetratricopeptide (TPR) repeat protein
VSRVLSGDIRRLGRDLLLVALVALAVPSGAKAAVGLDTAWNGCVAARISDAERETHCTAVIESGRFKGQQLTRALTNRGTARERQKNLSGALADFDEALRQDPALAEAYWHRGSVHEDTRDLDRALADFNRAVELAPKHPLARRSRAHLHLKRGEHAAAIEDATAAISLAPRPYVEYALRAMVYEAMRDNDKAMADYEKSLEIEPGFELARRGLGELRAQAAAVELPPGPCSAEGISNEARADGCRQAIADGKLTGRTLMIAYCNLGYALTELGQYDGVIESSDAAIKVDPNDACGYLNRGRAWYYKHDLDRAIADYTETIRRDPTFHEAFANRGTAYFDRREFDRAIADYDAAIAINPSEPMYFSDRGNTRDLMGEHQKAIADQTRAIEIEPRYAKAYVRRGWSYLKTDDYANAEASFVKALEIEPGHPEAETGLKRARDYREHPEHAADDREQAKGLNFDRFRRMMAAPQAPQQ